MLNAESIRAFAAANGLSNVEVLSYHRVYTTPESDAVQTSFMALVLASDDLHSAQGSAQRKPFSVRGAQITKGKPYDIGLLVHDPIVAMWKGGDVTPRDDMVITPGAQVYDDSHSAMVGSL